MPSVVTMTGPGTATVTDDAAAAIALQTTALGTANAALIAAIGPAGPAVPGTLKATLASISDNLGRIADQDKLIAKALSDLQIAVGTMSAAASDNNATQTILAASQIETNNFQTAVTKEALQRAGLPEPKMPTLEEQLKTSVKNGISFSTISTANGAIQHFLQKTITSTATWIAGTAPYMAVEGYLKKIKDTILAIEIPSLESIKNKIFSGKAT
jgi:hypothetical protein